MTRATIPLGCPARNLSGVAGWDDVIAIGERFPGVEVSTSYGRPALKVAGKFMCSLRQSPDAFVFRVLDVPDQQALVSGQPDVFFTTPHYDGWPYVLVNMDAVTREQLAELVEDAWRIRASKKLVAQLEGG
jgi:hypothetical protein